MAKIDFKKKLKHLYQPSAKEVVVVDIPVMHFLMIDGEGDPSKAKEFQEAIEALFSTAYTIKFLVKKEENIDYGVLPLEGLWWADDMSAFKTGKRDDWKWTLMIMQPEMVSEEYVKRAIEQVEKKKNPVALSKLRFEAFHEGPTVQIMHIGPFSEEGPNIQRIHDKIKEDKCRLKGKHHEIYLNDIRKVDPKKMKTILRQPFTHQ
ncbi:MAG: hypothetical protein UU48_C0004G0080 [Candidatus Uhrbacteria bacterium GW2011_GWF2_41_16]|uniref:GyrI-like small molecule binding domain-containing protein n=1 Tax=Candidatus Uhrbacteria bacterium GW2011_GWF2_41_16 TaxID=1618997 RepID=A0A0G0YD71_9BACT|nr:MAG: hypothetical protein UT33_C0016G0008 [Candidatus Peregrinibacteria bacterium GW2011_GWC2_39_14]KKR98287.1 MAG: hypothetical protein UU48_C0004G0080 [Candidatus Uhrbacteria bacterium GW2011_GWF2_41_16]HBP00240.1 hypothetical protein [Candidatus Uhrbacteria bacterium]